MKAVSKFERGSAQIVVRKTEDKRRPLIHFGVICGDDAATFILKPEVGSVLERALQVISDDRHRRH
jgi:hypothetical protein